MTTEIMHHLAAAGRMADVNRILQFEMVSDGLQIVGIVIHVGAAGWHGRRIAFVRRKRSKHFVSIVRIRHEGVIVQFYAVRLHVRNIDGAKQWLDITRERNLGRLFMFALLFYHTFSSIFIVAYLTSAVTAASATLAQRTSLGSAANVWNFLAEGGS